MPTKIDRATVPSPQKLATPVSRAAAVERETPRVEAAATFNAPSLPDPSPLSPRGQHVAATADPGALWGEHPHARFDPQAFARLPPAEQQARIAEWEARREVAGERIHRRVRQLDRRWGTMRVSSKCEALREYQERAQALDPSTRAHVDSHLDRAEAAQRRINALQARVERLGRKRPQDAAVRQQLAADLKAARAEQSVAVKEATKVIDDQGLKVDRLAQTEQLIDPNAPKGAGSLLDTVLSWFSYTWNLFSFSSHIELERTHEQHKKKEKEVVQEQLLDERVRGDMLRARLNEELVRRRTLGTD